MSVVVAASDSPPGMNSGTNSSFCRTQFFSLDVPVHGCCGEVGASVGSVPEQPAWARELQELELSKVNYQRAVQRQNLVEQGVNSLLKRLNELPVERPGGQPDMQRQFGDGGRRDSRSTSAESMSSDAGAANARVAGKHAEALVYEIGVDAIKGTGLRNSNMTKMEHDCSSYAFDFTQKVALARQAHAAMPQPISTKDFVVSSARKNTAVQSSIATACDKEPISPALHVDELDAAVLADERLPMGNTPTSPLCTFSPSGRPAVENPQSPRMFGEASPFENVPQTWIPGASWAPRAPCTWDSPAQVDHSPLKVERTSRVYETPPHLNHAVLGWTPAPIRAPHFDEKHQNLEHVGLSVSSMNSFANTENRSVTDFQPPRISLQVGKCPPADLSLIPRGKTADNDLWHGWAIETTLDGHLFYHHKESGISEWWMPQELISVLGEWIQVNDPGGGMYWRNELLGISSWNDPRHTTSLFQAALDGDLFFLQLYNYAGGFLDVADAGGRTALHYSCASGSSQLVLYLLQSRSCVDTRDEGGATPLHWACNYGHAAVVRILLEERANPDSHNSCGETPMHKAAELGLIEPLQWLIFAKADPTHRNKKSRTAAEVAIENGANDAAILLKRHERHFRGNQEDSGESDTDGEEEPLSPALKMVRAARPVLRGVQWLANRVLGEKRTNLGANNEFRYDAYMGQWTLAADPTDPDESAASGTDDDSALPPHLWQKPGMQRQDRTFSDSDALFV